jgi:broad specificity phosphatase PhoE
VSSLVLVRHGQASLHGDDYDVLSERGAEQSRELGRFWAERERFDAIYVGPQRRHRETEAALREGAAERGLELPPAQVLEGLAEMDAASVFGAAMARVSPSCPDLRERLASGDLDEVAQTALHHMAGIVAKLIERWAGGEDVAPGMEPFADFEQRVVESLQAVMKAERRGRRVAVITSGGPICLAVRLALKITPERAVGLMTVLANASVSELLFRESQLTLARFNAVDHLPRRLMTRV